MEYVNGIITMQKKAGIAIRILSHAICPTWPIINVPMNTNTGEVAAGGTSPKTGPKNIAIKKYIAITTADNPVLAPAAAPEEVSMQTIIGEHPVHREWMHNIYKFGGQCARILRDLHCTFII